MPMSKRGKGQVVPKPLRATLVSDNDGRGPLRKRTGPFHPFAASVVNVAAARSGPAADDPVADMELCSSVRMSGLSASSCEQK